ncbi:MAG: hypothetical protein LC798_10985, partial [Chloroflexi bacterium]|nr:hypothetical protein [Chloroflexota bacterium]
IAQAFGRHAPDWTVNSAVHSAAYTDYPIDQPWRQPVLRQLWEAADVAHLHNRFSTARLFEKHVGAKPTLIHYHGTVFRSDPWHLLREQRQRRAVGIVSTLDLWGIAPDDLTWLPAPYDLDMLMEIRRAQRPELQHGRRSGRDFRGDRQSIPQRP